MRGKIISILTALAVFCGNTAYASVLGEERGGWATDMGASTTYHRNTFISPSAGLQTENYVEYSPNGDAKPIVVNGWSIWGTRKLDAAASYMYDNGLRPIAGINADFFSFKTGISMGNAVINGEIVTTENSGQDAVAFRSDGSAFVDWIDIRTTVTKGDKTVNIDCINKWYQTGYDPIFLITDKFGDRTHTSCNCLFVICTPVEGRLRIGEAATYQINDSFVYEGDVSIPEGKAVLMISTNGVTEQYEFMQSLRAGDTITITNSVADGDNAKWEDVENLVSSVGGRIIMNGEIRDVTDNQTAPRTAIGTRDDGSSVFYTLDGRQKDYSYGAQIRTIAERLKELGCTNAINLDGGGSTTIGAVFPGDSEFLLMNRPSDGSMRSVANFLFIRDDRKRTDIPWVININDDGSKPNYLSGMTKELNVLSVYDTSNYKIENPDYRYELLNGDGADCYIDENGTISFKGTGAVSVNVVSGDAVKTLNYYVYETPDELKVYNSADWKEIDAIYTEANEELQLNLAAAAFVGGNELNQYDGLFDWSVEGNVGTITNDGIFTLTDTNNEKGKIIVRAGDRVKEIPVEIYDYPQFNPFADTNGHWAKDTISAMNEYGIIKGMEENGAMYFFPDNNMTRAQFASMMCNYLGFDLSAYTEGGMDFADGYDIPEWAMPCVNAMADKMLMTGRANGDGTVCFAPNDNITRAEVMKILHSIRGEEVDLALEFEDTGEIPEWALNGVRLLTAMGVVNGYEDNTIRPNNNVTRAEAAVMISKFREQMS